MAVQLSEEAAKVFRQHMAERHKQMPSTIALPGKYAIAFTVDDTTVVHTFQTLEEMQAFEASKGN